MLFPLYDAATRIPIQEKSASPWRPVGQCVFHLLYLLLAMSLSGCSHRARPRSACEHKGPPEREGATDTGSWCRAQREAALRFCTVRLTDGRRGPNPGKQVAPTSWKRPRTLPWTSQRGWQTSGTHFPPVTCKPTSSPSSAALRRGVGAHLSRGHRSRTHAKGSGVHQPLLGAELHRGHTISILTS